MNPINQDAVNQDREVPPRQPLDPGAVHQEIDDVFSFLPPIHPDQHHACQKLSEACKALAHAIAQNVPEGKEQTVAINNLLGVALWARHGITRRQVMVVTAAPWNQEPPPQVTEIQMGAELTPEEQAAFKTPPASATT